MKKRKMLAAACMVCGILSACGEAEQSTMQDTTESTTIQAQLEETATLPVQETTAEAEEATTVEATTEETETEETTAESNQGDIQITFSEDGSQDFNSEDGTLVFRFSESFPTVVIQGNEAASEKINNIYSMEKSNMDFSRQAYYGMAQSTYEGLTDEERTEFKPYSYDYTVTQGRCDGSVISFVEVGTQNTGGEIPHVVSGAMNFDPATGARIKFKDITETPDALKKVCIEYIRTACENGEYEGTLYDDYNSGIDSMIQEGVWYFSDEGLSIICNEYIIADADQGIFTFTIPYDKLEGLNEAYMR